MAILVHNSRLAGPGCGRSSCDRQLVFVNGRPVDWPRLARALTETFRAFGTNNAPALVLRIELPNVSMFSAVIGNLETVIGNLETVISNLETVIQQFQGLLLLVAVALACKVCPSARRGCLQQARTRMSQSHTHLEKRWQLSEEYQFVTLIMPAFNPRVGL